MIELLLAAESELALGRPDTAERTFRQVLAADPGNAIATVGLARVALERGDEPRALALAREAVELDPENATARRMIERLEEEAGPAEAPAAEAPAAAPAAAATSNPPGPPPGRPAPPPPARPAPARPGLIRRLLRRS